MRFSVTSWRHRGRPLSETTSLSFLLIFISRVVLSERESPRLDAKRCADHHKLAKMSCTLIRYEAGFATNDEDNIGRRH